MPMLLWIVYPFAIWTACLEATSLHVEREGTSANDQA